MNTITNDLALTLKAIIDTAIDGIITIDTSGIIETLNKAAASIFQYTQDEVIGQNIKMLMPEPDRSRHDEYLQRYLDTKNPKIIGIGREVVGKKKDGTTFPFRLAVSEVILNDRLIFTGVIHDLTDVSEANELLKKANQQLERKVEERTDELERTVNTVLTTNKKLEIRERELEEALVKEKDLSDLKSRFVSMASHEFRTPLSTIMSSASLISKYPESTQNSNRLKHVDRIKSAVSNLTGILNDFLSLSKLEEGKVEFVAENVSMTELCQVVNDELEGLLKSGQRMEHHSVGQSHTLVTDKRILKNVLFNIISNAIKYSKEGDLIGCRVEYQQHQISISITDSGIGIPMNEQKHLFDRFFRASNAEAIQGTGLGLHIVKQYVALLNGEVTFKSIQGEGTTFTVSLPYRI